MNIFNGSRVKFARLYNGLTVDELAKKLDITPQAESQYEMDKVTPQFEKLISLSKILNFPIDFFFQNDSVTIEAGSSYFRSLMKTPKKYRTEQKTKVQLFAKLFSIINEYVDFPELDLPTDVESYDSPEEAAQYIRDFWKLGDKPIQNVVKLLESKGIIVTTFDTNTTDIDAFSQFFRLNGKKYFFIAYSNNKESAARINFDLAHELGHIILHTWNEDLENCSRDEFKQKEKEANEFAAAFLLPKESFVKDARFFPTEISHYTELKKKWRVSIGAMIHRACELGIISMNQYQYMIRTMSAKGMRISEPLDNILEIPYPRLMKDAFDLLITNDVFTKQELLEEFSNVGLSMEKTELEKLFTLKKGFFDEEEIDDFSPIVLKINKE